MAASAFLGHIATVHFSEGEKNLTLEVNFTNP